MLNKLSHSNFDEVFEEFSTSNCINGDDNLISLAVDIMMEKVAKKPTSAGVLAKLVQIYNFLQIISIVNSFRYLSGIQKHRSVPDQN